MQVLSKLQQLIRMGNTGYKVNPNILFWIRVKTLSSNNDISHILEIAYIYTDMKLTTYQMGSHIVIQCSKEEFQSTDSKQLHFAKTNGLYDACINSKIGVGEAEDLIMKDIKFRNIARGQLLAAGKQVHLAKYALMRHMPKLHDFLHYRIFDLSSVQLVVERFKETGVESIVNKDQTDENTKENNKNEKKNGANLKHWRLNESEKGINLSEVIGGEKRAQEELWKDIHEMQFYTQNALNDL